jgi:hypothetical protein
MMRQVSVIDKSWTELYLKKTREVNKKFLILKDGADEKKLILRKRKHAEMDQVEKRSKAQIRKDKLENAKLRYLARKMLKK